MVACVRCLCRVVIAPTRKPKSVNSYNLVNGLPSNLTAHHIVVRLKVDYSNNDWADENDARDKFRALKPAARETMEAFFGRVNTAYNELVEIGHVEAPGKDLQVPTVLNHLPGGYNTLVELICDQPTQPSWSKLQTKIRKRERLAGNQHCSDSSSSDSAKKDDSGSSSDDDRYKKVILQIVREKARRVESPSNGNNLETTWCVDSSEPTSHVCKDKDRFIDMKPFTDMGNDSPVKIEGKGKIAFEIASSAETTIVILSRALYISDLGDNLFLHLRLKRKVCIRHEQPRSPRVSIMAKIGRDVRLAHFTATKLTNQNISILSYERKKRRSSLKHTLLNTKDHHSIMAQWHDRLGYANT